jgi:hypothetical protein
MSDLTGRSCVGCQLGARILASPCTTQNQSVCLVAWTHRTAADAATWVAPTCCSERAPRRRSRRIGFIEDFTRKTASRPLDTRWDDSFPIAKGAHERWPDAAADRVVTSPTVHLLFPTPALGPGSANLKTTRSASMLRGSRPSTQKPAVGRRSNASKNPICFTPRPSRVLVQFRLVRTMPGVLTPLHLPICRWRPCDKLREGGLGL